MRTGEVLFVSALQREELRDDVLFLVGEPTRLAVVYRTGSGRREASADWPSTELFASLEELLARRGSD